MRRKGFTLLEVLIVVIMIGILASIALPQYASTIEKARSAEAIINIYSIKVMLDAYWYDHGLDLTGATLPVDGSQGTLTLNNPNAVENTDYTYTVSGLSGPGQERAYIITATRTVGEQNYTLWWVQEDNHTGKLYKSANLGGPVYIP